MTYHVVGRPERSPGGAFELHMQANRSSLPFPTHYVVVAAGTALALLSIRFMALGAWPVAIFSLIDIGLLAGALHVFARRSPPTEQLSLRDGEVVWRASDGREIAMLAYWTKLEAEERAPLDLTLWLRFREDRHQVGQCLSLDERREVAGLIGKALGDVRGWA